MRLFVFSQDNDIWSDVENLNYVLMTLQLETSMPTPKSQAEWIKDDNDKAFLNSKAQFISLYSS